MADHQSIPFESTTATGFGSKRFREALNAMHACLHRDLDLEPCTYCGVPANSIDHVPPQSVRPRLIALGLAMRYRFLTVPACRECNSAIGARSLFTVEERRKWIKKWLRRHYAEVLRIPNWTDTELAQLAPAFRNYVLRGIVLREWVSERVAWKN